MNSFDGRVVLVTGGTGGLGVAVVKSFLARGAEVVVPSPGASLGGPLAEVKSDRLQIIAGVDLTDESAAEKLYAGLPSLWASVHLAGGFVMKPVAETRLADLRAQLQLNFETAFLCCREAVKTMRARPHQDSRGGRIVNVTSRPVLVPAAGMIAYATSKAAVASLTQSLAAEVADDHILVNAIVPSIIDTPANRRSMPDADFSKWPNPEQLAETIGFLTSPENALTTGTLVPVYGRS